MAVNSEFRPVENKSTLRLLLTSLVPLFVFAHLTHHLLTALATPLSPFIRDEFNLNTTQVGWILSAFSLSYGIGQLPGGWLADHIGPRILITLSIVGVAVAGFFIGLSNSVILLVAFLIVMGLLGGGYHPSSAPLLMASVEPKNRSKALGFHMIGGTGSHFLTPIIGAALATVWGWRGAYFGLAVPSIIFGVVFFILLGRYNRSSAAVERKARNEAEVEVRRLNTGRMTFFIAMNTILHAFNNTAISFIPLYMVSRFGVDKGVAAGLLSLVYGAGMVASPFGGFLADRIGQMPVILIPTLLSGVFFFTMNNAPYGIAIYVLLFAIGMIGPMRNPVSEAYIVQGTPSKRRSTMLGFYFFGNMESVGLLMPVMGYAVDRLGFQTAYTGVSGILLLGAAVFLVAFWRDRK